ncbi:lasso peptide biosynthesis PqqD family chaperone [Lentibacillus sp. Marseille-P4043]|uniref:lasso peptide biosynthesis PqqD family chaperone n=1 Tax=Lentibacillus sp. Marseille-P4043 TaxID=2040293 RepID=UPI000D0BD782|nr:lasso peptide biosynthesis PqqD family chaperone [Lentibacillus sp. Marseille-P4043]
MRKSQNLMLNQLVKQGSDSIVSDMGGEKVMLSIPNSKYYNLGEIGGEIWERIKSPISIKELIHTLTIDYEVEQSTCKEQVLAFLNRLFEEDLIQVEESAS